MPNGGMQLFEANECKQYKNLQDLSTFMEFK